jgi:methionyl-tRNA synthetase
MFITTAIDYVNSKPHIGHAFEKVLADTIARFYPLPEPAVAVHPSKL